MHRLASIQQQFPQFFPERRAARFAGDDCRFSIFEQKFLDPLQLGTFARSVHALEGDELAGKRCRGHF